MESRSEHAPLTCVEQLSKYNEKLDILIVSIPGRPEDWLRLMGTHLSVRPANVGFVVSGESVRSRQMENDPVSIREGISLRPISSVNGLVGLSISSIENLSEWGDNEQRSVDSFDSVTALLQYAEDDRELQVLETLTEQLHDIATAGYFA